MPLAARTTLADVCMVVLRRAAGSWTPETTHDRFRRVAQLFVEVGQLSPADFSGFLAEAMVSARAQQLKQLESTFASASVPGHWRTALQTLSDEVLASVTESDFFVPVEFRGICPKDAAIEATRGTLAKFGQLLDLWPALRSHIQRRGIEDLIERPR
jgi:hypothetical protein